MASYVCPERQTYDFIKQYVKLKGRDIEIGTLHTLLTKHVDQESEIDGVDVTFPWRARGFTKFLQFVQSIPGLKWNRTKANNHCVSIDEQMKNIESFFIEMETVPIKIKSKKQRKQKRADRKKWRHKKAAQSFHRGYDVLKKLSFLAMNECKSNEEHISLRNSFYSPMSNLDVNVPLNNINWSKVPSNLCPEQVILNSSHKRGTWKKRQIETFYEILRHLLAGNGSKEQTVVDFGCGSGNIGLCLAFLFPSHRFVLIDYNPYCIKIAKERVQMNGLENVKVIEAKIEDFNGSFDIGIACHACGAATDYAQIKCFRQKAQFVLCSCCVGKIKLNEQSVDENEIEYPRSDIFKKEITRKDFEELSRIADHSQSDYNERSNERNLCKTVLELDRCFCALQTNIYQVLLTKIIPFNEKDCHSQSPKNDVIVGITTKNANKLYSNLIFQNIFRQSSLQKD